MVDGRESKKRQEKIFWRFFVSRPAVYRRFGEKLIPMSNDYCIFEQQLIILSIMYKENEGFARLPPLNHCQEGVKCICRKFSFFIERATLWE